VLAIALLLADAVMLSVLGHGIRVAETGLPEDQWPGFTGVLLQIAAVILVLMTLPVYWYPRVCGTILLAAGSLLLRFGYAGDDMIRDCTGECWSTFWTLEEARTVSGLAGVIADSRPLSLTLFLIPPLAGLLLLVGGFIAPRRRRSRTRVAASDAVGASVSARGGPAVAGTRPAASELASAAEDPDRGPEDVAAREERRRRLHYPWTWVGVVVVAAVIQPLAVGLAGKAVNVSGGWTVPVLAASLVAPQLALGYGGRLAFGTVLDVTVLGSLAWMSATLMISLATSGSHGWGFAAMILAAVGWFLWAFVPMLVGALVARGFEARGGPHHAAAGLG
jgi:hypothetical protein